MRDPNDDNTKRTSPMKNKWLDKPQQHDYTAAASYLSLTMDHSAAKTAAKKMKEADMTEFAAKDIFRASGLSLLGVSNSHVEKDIARMARNEAVSFVAAQEPKGRQTDYRGRVSPSLRGLQI